MGRAGERDPRGHERLKVPRDKSREERAMSQATLEPLAVPAALHLEGRSVEALDELCRVRDAGNHSAKLYYAIGHLQLHLGHIDAAARTYEDLQRLESKDSTPPYNLA